MIRNDESEVALNAKMLDDALAAAAAANQAERELAQAKVDLAGCRMPQNVWWFQSVLKDAEAKAVAARAEVAKQTDAHVKAERARLAELLETHCQCDTCGGRGAVQVEHDCEEHPSACWHERHGCVAAGTMDQVECNACDGSGLPRWTPDDVRAALEVSADLERVGGLGVEKLRNAVCESIACGLVRPTEVVEVMALAIGMAS